MHVKPHALVIHVFEKVVIVVAVIFLSIHRHSLNDYTVDDVSFFDITDKILPQLAIICLILLRFNKSSASFELDARFLYSRKVGSELISKPLFCH